MGSATGPAGLSLASTGLQAAGTMEAAQGTQEADNYKAALLDRAADYGELKAKQTNAQLTFNLSQTLGNIDAVRAAAHADPSSPTGAAVRGQVESIDTNKKNIQVDSILAQSQEDEANAAYLRQAGHQALLAGKIGAGADILKGLAGAIPGFSGLKFGAGSAA